MNFIYVHTHDSGREIEPYGANTRNPGLMRLAEDSTLFRNAHCAAPTCSPSRAAMLTGMTAHQSGMLGLAHRGFRLNDYSQHIAQYLGRNGYYTALFGVQHEVKDVSELGYNEAHTEHVMKGKPADRSDYKTLELAKEFLASGRNGEMPFFLSVGLRSTHREFVESDHSRDGYVKAPPPIYDTPETRRDYCNYLKTLDIADECVNELLDAVEENNLSENTVIMFTTDHGIAFPQMKGTLYDGGTGVALMLKIPGKCAGVSDALVSHIDVFPTVCDVLGVPYPEWIQGKSLMPIIDGKAEEINDCIFSESTYHATYEPMRSVRTKKAKLIRYYEEDTRQRLANTDASPSKDAYFSSKLPFIPRAKEMLFDLVADPSERMNLIGVEEYEDTYKQLSDLLDRHMKETDDPLLFGQVAQRDEWVMNLPFAIEPNEPTYNNKGEIWPIKKKKTK